jgi:hypothetical protein
MTRRTLGCLTGLAVALCLACMWSCTTAPKPCAPVACTPTTITVHDPCPTPHPAEPLVLPASSPDDACDQQVVTLSEALGRCLDRVRADDAAAAVPTPEVP